jgi:hypothetical protein
MDRFFSKLDLRDIRIDPEAKFPPTEDGYADREESYEPTYTNGADDSAAPAAVLAAEETVVAVETDGDGEVLKVSARSRPSAVAAVPKCRPLVPVQPTRQSRLSQSLVTTCSKPVSKLSACRHSSTLPSTTRTGPRSA